MLQAYIYTSARVRVFLCATMPLFCAAEKLCRARMLGYTASFSRMEVVYDIFPLCFSRGGLVITAIRQQLYRIQVLLQLPAFSIVSVSLHEYSIIYTIWYMEYNNFNGRPRCARNLAVTKPRGAYNTQLFPNRAVSCLATVRGA